VSPVLYGILVEERYHSVEGGLHAELIKNRSFEDGPTPVGWSLVKASGTESNMELDLSQPLNAENPRSMRLEIKKAGAANVGIANDGLGGITVVLGQGFRLSFYARRNEVFSGPLLASLEGISGEVYAQAKLEGLITSWKRFECALAVKRAKPEKTDSNSIQSARTNIAGQTPLKARLVIAGSTAGTVWLDQVSLMPERTWKGRANGFRDDLAQMLADLKPGFVRFPGGHFVNGDRLSNAYRWKTTIGDVVQRPGHQTPWGYRSSDGIGFHEYLMFCEDLGALPWFVINCGMAHSGTVPIDQIGPWVKDARDALAYANGPLTNYWSGLRAQQGHPAPFGLRVIEIGNENGGLTYNQHKNFLSGEHGGVDYEARFPVFYQAIKDQCPEVQVMANGFLKDSQPDLVDEHLHGSPEWFLSSVNRYDDYDRHGPRVCIGEFSCSEECGQGNLLAALAEAAFLTGVERNSDLVTMACYGPLLANANVRSEYPGAIRFNNSACYGTPSYHVQKLFSQHRPDVVLPVRVVSETVMPKARGAIGLGAWRTQVEFKDIVVRKGDQVLYQSDFSAGAPGWRVMHGRWQAQDGAYRQSALDDFTHAVAGDYGWTDYSLSLKARKLGGDEGFQIQFRVREDKSCYWWNLGGWRNACFGIEKVSGASWPLIGAWPVLVSGRVPGRIETGRWYDIRIELYGPRMRCYLDGQLVHNCEDPALAPLTAVAGRVEATGELVLKVVNVSDKPHDTAIALDGAEQVATEGMAVVLSADRPTVENDFAQPARIVPVTQAVTNCGVNFRHTFAPYSLTILRLKAK